MKFGGNINLIEAINKIIRQESENYSRVKLLEYSDRIYECIGQIIILTMILAGTTMYKCFEENEYLEIFTAGTIAVHLSYLGIKIFDKVSLNFRNIIKGIFLAIISIPFICEVFLIYYYDRLIKTGIIMVLLETNIKEVQEFLEASIGITEIISLVVIIFIVSFIIRHWKQLKMSCSLSDNIKVNMMRIYLISVVGAFVIFRFCCWNTLIYEMWLYPQLRVIGFTVEAFNNIREYEKIINKMNCNVEIEYVNDEVSNIVFVVGESTNRNYMELYGHDLPTTPYLSKLACKNELAVFTDCISPYPCTINVLRELFTFHNAEASGMWYNYNNMIDVMNEAGYRTIWLSNQESSGVWGNVARAIASRCDYTKFTRKRDSRDDAGNDSEVFPLISEALKQCKSNKNFYVIHLMGCHLEYDLRYSQDFTFFTFNDIKKDLSKYKKRVVAHYENAVLFNDYVVNNIINEFRSIDEDTIIIYVADHGENVYDFNNMLGHVEGVTYPCNFEIPMIIWASDKFKKKHVNKWENICRATDKPYMSDDMIHTIMDIAGIKTPEYDMTKSIINPAFNVDRKRIANACIKDRFLYRK